MLEVDEINSQLSPRFASLKQEMGQLYPPGSLEATLLKAFEARQSSQPSTEVWWRKCFAEPWQWSGVLAMGLLVVLMIVNKPYFDSSGFPVATEDSSFESADALYEEIPFLAIESGEMILKQDNMRIVRADIPNTILASFGLPVNPQEAGESARAEMLVGENDEYLALRFVPSD